MRIVRPLLLPELKESVVRTILRHISTLLIARRILVNTFSVQPLIEGTAVVKYTIQNDLHASAVYFLHKLSEKLITRLQILLICHTADIAGG